MSKRARILWHLIPASLARSAARPATRRDTRRISGQVTDSTAQQPLAGAEVVILGDGGATLRGARTDAAGRYVITNVPLASSGCASGSSATRQKKSLTVRDGQTTTVDFAPHATVAPTRSGRRHRHRRRRPAARGRQRRRDHQRDRRPAGRARAQRRATDRRAHAGRHRAPGDGPGGHRRADPHSRREQPLAQQRSDRLHRRRAHGSRRRTRAGATRRRRREPSQRHQSRRHREHRDHQGTGGGDALRHRSVERRHPDHHQARTSRRRTGTSRRARERTGWRIRGPRRLALR